jgi:hypothetical protein
MVEWEMTLLLGASDVVEYRVGVGGMVCVVIWTVARGSWEGVK